MPAEKQSQVKADERNRWESAAAYDRKRVRTEMTLDPQIRNIALRTCKKLGISLSRFAEEAMQTDLIRRGAIPFRRTTDKQ